LDGVKLGLKINEFGFNVSEFGFNVSELGFVTFVAPVVELTVVPTGAET
jgi:hypothetical protein